MFRRFFLCAKDAQTAAAADLTAAQDALTAKENELANVQNTLAATENVLVLTQDALGTNESLITIIKESLVAKDGVAAKEPMLFLHLLSTDAATLTGTDTTALDAENYLTVGEQTCAPIPMPEEGSYFCLIHGINMNLFHITADGIELVNASADHNCLALGEITMTIVSRDALKQE